MLSDWLSLGKVILSLLIRHPTSSPSIPMIICLAVQCLKKFGEDIITFTSILYTTIWLPLALHCKYVWLLSNQYEAILHAHLSSRSVLSVFLLESRCLKLSLLWMHHFRHLVLNKCVLHKSSLYYANSQVVCVFWLL